MAKTYPYTEATALSQSIPTFALIQNYGWTKYTDDGTQWAVGPVFDAGASNEANWHRLTVTWGGGGSVYVRGASYSSPQTAEQLFTGSASISDEVQLTSGVEYIFPTPYRGRCDRYAYPILRVSGTVMTMQVTWTVGIFSGGYCASEARTCSFAGGTLRYRVQWPRDYDAEGATDYPLVLALAGDGSQGGDNTGQVLAGGQTMWGKWAFDTYYFGRDGGGLYQTSAANDYEHIGVLLQMPDDDALSGVDSPYWPTGAAGKSVPPYHPGAGAAVNSALGGHALNEGGWFPSAVAALIEALLADADFAVDADRVYLTGFSRGGYAAWQIAVAARDFLAGLLVVDGGVSFGAVSYEATTNSIWQAWTWWSAGETTLHTVPLADHVACVSGLIDRISHIGMHLHVGATEIGEAAVAWDAGDEAAAAALYGDRYAKARDIEGYYIAAAGGTYEYHSGVSVHDSMPQAVYGDVDVVAALFADELTDPVPDDAGCPDLSSLPPSGYSGRGWDYAREVNTTAARLRGQEVLELDDG